MALQSTTPEDASPLLILFGPQKPCLSQIHALNLASTMRNNEAFSFLLDAIRGLPLLWRDIKNSCPRFNHVLGEHQLRALSKLLCNGAKLDEHDYGSIFLMPLTVIAHSVEYLQFNESGITQGFCVGFLAAAAAASSSTKVELQASISKALNLAVCIGAVVDADAASTSPASLAAQTYSVTWKDDAQANKFDSILENLPGVSKWNADAHMLVFLDVIQFADRQSRHTYRASQTSTGCRSRLIGPKFANLRK